MKTQFMFALLFFSRQVKLRLKPGGNGIFALVLLICFSLSAFADTTYVASGPVSGVWEPTGNPYFVHQGDIFVDEGDTLIIMPGVEALFTGRYKFIVYGRLNADGLEGDSIVFTRAYPTEESKWRGFRFDNADDGSSLSWCRIEYAKGEGAYPDVRGGGIWIDDCMVWIRHCVIAHNYTHNANYNGSGGGIFMENSQSVIETCHFIDNLADNGGGICVGSGSNPTIQLCTFEDNEVYSSGGGIYVSANAEATICFNTFENNQSNGIFGGGAINLWCATWLYGTTATVYSNLIIDNHAAGSGGGIYSRYDGSFMYNNTIAGNSANAGGGIYVLTYSYLPPTIYNSIVWGNTASVGPQIYLDPQTSSAANITYCDVEGGWQGMGNFDDDPLFATGADGNYYLSHIACGQNFTSPCVDAGDPASANIVGTTRTDGELDSGVVDIGYHYLPGETPGWLYVGMNPSTTPIQIPPEGGGFQFEISAVNVGGNWMQFDAWTVVLLPDSTYYGPTLLRQNISISPGQCLYREGILQWVPANAPAGDYQYIIYVGDYPDNIIDSDSFPFEKLWD